MKAHGAPRRAVIRIVTLSARLLRVTVCPLCAAVVTTSGIDQHARVHAVAADRTGFH